MSKFGVQLLKMVQLWLHLAALLLLRALHVITICYNEQIPTFSIESFPAIYAPYFDTTQYCDTK